MLDHATAALFALFLWWVGTGVVLYLDGLPTRTFRWSLAGSLAVLAASLYGLVLTSEGTRISDAYLAFGCAVTLWGCLEMTYFMGLLTGPRKTPCPADCGGPRRFLLAVGTSLYHELAVIATAALLALLTWNAPNQVGLWTFTVLWLMRWSAKLNVFLGVPNLNGNWLPQHLSFLHSYMGRRPMNHLFPFSVTGGTLVATLLGVEALAVQSDPFQSVGLTLVAALLALAVLEHWFLVMPVPDEALWSWAFRRQADDEGASPEPGARPGRRWQVERCPTRGP
jgi:putative photosynthetic complex assembly protein 2